MVSGLLLVMKGTSPLLCVLMLKCLLVLLVLGFNSMDLVLTNELRVEFTCLVNIDHLCFLERKNKIYLSQIFAILVKAHLPFN